MKCAYCDEEIRDATFSCPTCKGKLHRDCLNPHIDYWADDPEAHAELRENPTGGCQFDGGGE
jgi:hypothetical protein